MRTDVAKSSVLLASNLVWLESGVPSGLISLVLGLVGVALARWVFVNREARRTNTPQRWKDTVPLTLVAMLVTAVLINDRHLSLSASAFLGLGVGWVAVILLDVFGERVIYFIRGSMSSGPAVPDLFPKNSDFSGHEGKVDAEVKDPDPSMIESLRSLDQIHYLPPTPKDDDAPKS